MAIHNLGSINIDHLFTVAALPAPGETVISQQLRTEAGGKGLNMSIAMARAGAGVYHYGCVGSDGQWLVDALTHEGVNTDAIARVSAPTGSAIVCVDANGENQIIVNPGANHAVDGSTLKTGKPGDWALFQNETSGQTPFVKAAKAQGMTVAYAAAPFDLDVALAVLPMIDCLIVNQIEAAQLCHATAKTIDQLGPAIAVVTQGGAGSIGYARTGAVINCPALPAQVVDTTAAGDTYTGYLLSTLSTGQSLGAAMKLASRAASIAVSRSGAAASIPFAREL
ncbi:ribokinase [Litorivicinus lipolyticus]|uniref:ribokinase n=1 Tax=Litorivicinus lipolyticus TaxID=418701 RepID=UPI003B5A8D27